MVIEARRTLARTAARTLPTRFGSSSVLNSYSNLLSKVKGKEDPAQEAVVHALDNLRVDLEKHQWARMIPALDFMIDSKYSSALSSWRAPRGIYISGSVGAGKTMLMDMFIDALLENTPQLKLIEEEVSDSVSKQSWCVRRTHFHRFMLDVHGRIHNIRGQSNDPLLRVAADLARESPLICFDEFQVTDVADALILHRLFKALFLHGVVVVATSNRQPAELYEGGINRSLFLPFIDLIEQQCATIDMTTAGVLHDYRAMNAALDGETSNRRFLRSDADLDSAFDAFAAQSGGSSVLPVGPKEVPVAQGRALHVASAVGSEAARFDFNELFHANKGAADYLAIAGTFHTIFLRGVPQLDSSKHNETRRFITFVDILYENDCLLVCSCVAPLGDLFRELEVDVGNDERVDRDSMVGGGSSEPADRQRREPALAPLAADPPTGRLREEAREPSSSVEEGAPFGLGTTRAVSGSESVPRKESSRLAEPPPPGQPQSELSVAEEGGSSGRVTTMIGSMEWSATGRLGVSLAELSAVKDVGFAFRRALSRLIEMQTAKYEARHKQKHRTALP